MKSNHLDLITLERPDEKHPLINHKENISSDVTSTISLYSKGFVEQNDVLLNITTKNEPIYLDNCTQEIADIICSDIPYKENVFKKNDNNEKVEKLSTGLIALRLTSQALNKLVENTPSGKLARTAVKLESNILTSNTMEGVAMTIAIATLASSVISAGTFIGGSCILTFNACVLTEGSKKVLAVAGGTCATTLFGAGSSISLNNLFIDEKEAMKKVIEIRDNLTVKKNMTPS